MTETTTTTLESSSSMMKYLNRPEVDTGYVEPVLDGNAHKILENLFLGSMESCHSLDTLRDNNITGIVNCCPKRCPNAHERDQIDYCIVSVNDDAHANIAIWFRSATLFIHRHLTTTQGGKCLVHCQYGVSRSATIVIAYLMEYLKYSLEEAYVMTKSRRPQANPNEGFWRQLQAYEKELSDPTITPHIVSLENMENWLQLSFIKFCSCNGKDDSTCFSSLENCRDESLWNKCLRHGLDLALGKGLDEVCLNWYCALCDTYNNAYNYNRPVQPASIVNVSTQSHQEKPQTPASLQVWNIISSEQFIEEWGSDFSDSDRVTLFNALHIKC